MFRSAERVVAAIATGLLVAPLPAQADEPTVTPAPGPTPGVHVAEAPVLDLRAVLRDLAFTSADTGGIGRIEDQPGRIKVTLDATLLFGKDSATLRATVRGRLAEIATQLRKRGPGRVAIVGYTDDLGTAAHGLDLSRRRAGAVAAALRPMLPAASFPFTTTGKGEAEPVVPNDSEANRRRNRRVELTYLPG